MVRDDTSELPEGFAEFLGIRREGRETFQQLQNEKIQLYAELGNGSGASEAVVEGIYERIGAQIELLSAKIAAEVRAPGQMSKALVPVACAQV
ncbi:hypothetical protein AB0876_32345 [Mycobacterium sp. NPDC049093]